MLGNAFMILFVVILLIAVGFLCAHLKVLGDNASSVLSRLVLRVGMPALIFNNLLTKYDRVSLFQSAYTLLIPLLTLTALFLLSRGIARLLNLPENRRAIFSALFTFSNSIFVGLPVCTAILGDDSLTLCLLYYLVNTLFWWIIVAPQVAGIKKISIKKLASAPLVACLVCLILLIAGFKPPEILVKASSYLTNIVTPLSMLFIGYTLYSMFKKGLKWEKGYGMALAGKLIIAPALCLGLCLAMKLPADFVGAFFLQAGMPTQTQISLWTAEHHQDVEYATGGVVISTLASFVMIPVYAAILSIL